MGTWWSYCRAPITGWGEQVKWVGGARERAGPPWAGGARPHLPARPCPYPRLRTQSTHSRSAVVRGRVLVRAAGAPQSARLDWRANAPALRLGARAAAVVVGLSIELCGFREGVRADEDGRGVLVDCEIRQEGWGRRGLKGAYGARPAAAPAHLQIPPFPIFQLHWGRWLGCAGVSQDDPGRVPRDSGARRCACARPGARGRHRMPLGELWRARRDGGGAGSRQPGRLHGDRGQGGGCGRVRVCGRHSGRLLADRQRRPRGGRFGAGDCHLPSWLRAERSRRRPVGMGQRSRGGRRVQGCV